MFPLQLIKTLELDWLMELMVDKSLIELNGWTKLQMIQILIKALVCRITRLPYYVSKCWNCKRNCTDNNSLENNPFLFLIFFFFHFNLQFTFWVFEFNEFLYVRVSRPVLTNIWRIKWDFEGFFHTFLFLARL